MRLRCLVLAVCFSVSLPSASPRDAFADDAEQVKWNADRWMAEGWKRKAARDYAGALEAFREAKRAGAAPQLIAMELGYVQTQLGRLDAARVEFRRVLQGPNKKLEEQARVEIDNLARAARAAGTVAHQAMTRAYASIDGEEWDAAAEALEEARAAGWSVQAIDLQLGYVELQRERLESARSAFRAASEGEDPTLAEQAMGALSSLPPGLDEQSALDRMLETARNLRDQRRWLESKAAFEDALEDGADPQQVHYELGNLALVLREVTPNELRVAEAARKEAAEARKAAALKAEAERIAEELAAEGEEVVASTQGPAEAAPEAPPEAPELTPEEQDELEREARRREFAQRFLAQAYVMKRGGDLEGAIAAFRFARDAGAEPQAVDLEIGYVESLRGNDDAARRFFEAAADGPNEVVADLARSQLRFLRPDDVADWSGEHWSIQGHELKSEGKLEEARAAFTKAGEAGADARGVALELAVVAEALGESEEAEALYRSMVRGEAADAYEIRARGALARMDPREREEWTGDHWIAEADFLSGYGDYSGAINSLALARGAPAADEGVVAEYREAVAASRDWTSFAREELAAARTGDDRDLAAAAQKRLDELPPDGRAAWTAGHLLENGRFLRSMGELDEARDAYEAAREKGADEQTVELELGYLELSAERLSAARRHLRNASKGEDDDRAAQATAQLQVMPRLFRADIYADIYGYSRVTPQRFDNLIGFLRMRGLVRPIPFLDLEPYIFFQISRDVGSRGPTEIGRLPLILNDNALLLGGGILFRFWERRAGVYAQVAAAFKLIRDGDRAVDLDARVGAYLGLSAPTCSPAPQPGGARLELAACGEFYGDVTYVSRFDHNVFFFSRGRFGATYLVTGPVAWQPVVEGRFIKDVRNDYWNNLADVGFMHRWRLLKPIGVDLMLGIHAGRHLGLARVEPDGSVPNPVPDPAGFLDLRLLMATYLEF